MTVSVSTLGSYDDEVEAMFVCDDRFRFDPLGR